MLGARPGLVAGLLVNLRLHISPMHLFYRLKRGCDEREWFRRFSQLSIRAVGFA